ncbi:2-keto-4-pentenoate hydratase [Staphylococcus canis]|uniref:2-keto-4-pentenoate hydratase n=1 Tax=Staphylococcus canis TaxID=2724942 RepID=A0ABS0T8K0_9STAP|nr:fumarylacetoacetate hydrolase family protein [Staphylococcus canis]MBI5975046.1 2-keto-4-pentenoate hydratase [Staphylococcus canis]
MTQESQLATKIFKAYETKEPIPFLNPSEDIDEHKGYAIQNLLVKQLQDFYKASVKGYKVSMTSEETQAYANTHEPAYGTLFETSFYQSGDTLKLDQFFAPLIEPELAFIVTEDLPENPTEADILNHTQLAPAIEVPDARYIDWFPNFTLGDILADNTATGGVVLGETIPQLDYDTLKDVEMTLTFNGEVQKTGKATEVLGHPVKAVQWLAQKLVSHQKSLKKGDIISSGTFIPPIKAERGTFSVEYSNVGTVSVTFE